MVQWHRALREGAHAILSGHAGAAGSAAEIADRIREVAMAQQQRAPFRDFVITAQQAQAYKPDHRLFLHAHAAMRATREEIVHGGIGQFTIMKLCHELGIRSVWIDRAGEPPNRDWPPGERLTDLSRLPELLLAA